MDQSLTQCNYIIGLIFITFSFMFYCEAVTLEVDKNENASISINVCRVALSR
jgi:hypothetical protein